MNKMELFQGDGLNKVEVHGSLHENLKRIQFYNQKLDN